MRSPVYPEVEMVSIMIEGVQIDHCPRSGGLWLDGGELALLAKRPAEEVDAILREGTPVERLIHESSRLCPRDHTPLQQIEFPNYAHLKIDYCPTCGGVWLDARELSQALTLLGRPAHSPELPALNGGVLRLIQRLLGRG
ncbi:MAG: zf-TFIIB domain-containing protein [Aggregatilineales bacterium]